MVRTFLKVYMELGSYFLFLQEQIKDIIIITSSSSHHHHEAHAARNRPLGKGWQCASTLSASTHSPSLAYSLTRTHMRDEYIHMCIMFYMLWYIYNIYIHTHTQALINEVQGNGMHLYEMTKDISYKCIPSQGPAGCQDSRLLR